MKLFKVLKFIHDKFGIFINPIHFRPNFIYRKRIKGRG